MEKYAKSKQNKQHKNEFHSEVANIVQKVLKKNQELKSFDTGIASTIDSTGSVVKLTTIPQGDTDSSRDGDAIRVTRMEYWANATYADTTNAVRLIIARWNQDDSSSAPAAVTEVLQTASPYSPYNRDNLRAKKFTVLVDHLFVVSNVGPGIEKHIWKKDAMHNIAFQAAAATGTGHVYAFLVSDSGASTHPGFSCIFRTYFTDS